MQSMLEHQHNMFTEIINITKEIIEQQIVIKERTESLQTLNKSLQVKSLQLQQVLATSQAQLQAEISIPIELINQLAGAVRQLKDEQQERFGQLLLSLGEAHEQFEKQEHILEENIQENGKNEVKKEHCNGIEAWSKSNGSISRADSANSTLSNHLTILEIQDANGTDSPNNEDPASQSEEIIKNADDEVKGKNKVDGFVDEGKGKNNFN